MKEIIAILGDAPIAVDLALRRILKLGKNAGSVIILDYTGRGGMVLGESNRMGLLHQHVMWFDLADRRRPVSLFSLTDSAHFITVILRVLRMICNVSRFCVADATLFWAADAAQKLSKNGGVSLLTLLKSFSSTEIRHWFLNTANDPQDFRTLLDMLMWALRFPSVYSICEGVNKPDFKSIFEKPVVLWIELRMEYLEMQEYSLVAGLLDAVIENLIMTLLFEQNTSNFQEKLTVAHLFPPVSIEAHMPSWIRKSSKYVSHWGVFSLHADHLLNSLALSWAKEADEVWIPGKVRALQAVHDAWLTEEERKSVNTLEAGDLLIRSNRSGGIMVAKVGGLKKPLGDAYHLKHATYKPLRYSTTAQMASAASEIALPAVTHNNLYEKLCDIEMLRLGWLKVKHSSKDSHGSDGITIAMFKAKLDNELRVLCDELKSGRYCCRPLRRCYISKPDGGKRPLGITCVRDRIVQAACLTLLVPIFEPLFSPYSFAFRPFRNAHQAVALAKNLIAIGHEWVVSADIQKCFDNIDHDVLLNLLAVQISDQELLRLIRHWLSVDVFDFHEIIPTIIGVPQGESLSPLLANVYLDPIDKHFEQLGLRFVRYADDIIIFTETQEQAHEALQVLEDFLFSSLKLSLKPAKSNICTASDGFDFLGFRISSAVIKIRERKIDDVLAMLRIQIERLGNKASSLARDAEAIARINSITRGFRNYFALPEEERLGEQLEFLDRRVELMANCCLPVSIKDDPAWICRERFALPPAVESLDSLEESEERKAKTGSGYPDDLQPLQTASWMLKDDHSDVAQISKPSIVVEDTYDAESASDYNTYIEESGRLYILTHGSFLTLQSGNLVVRKQKHEIYSRSLNELGLVYLQGFGMTVSVGLQLKLAELDIPVVLAPPVGTPIAILNSIHSTKSDLRYCQVLRRDDSDIISTGLHMIAAKVGNQAAVLRYFAKYRKKTKSEIGLKLTEAANKIKALSEKIRDI